MRRVSLSSVVPGDELGATIKVPSPQAGVLYKLRLEEGTELTPHYIDRLTRMNIGRVPLKDSYTDDIDKYFYDEEVEKAEEQVRREFLIFQSKIESNQAGAREIDRLRSAVGDLIDSLRNTKLMAAFTNLKTHDNYTAEHSLDVTKITLQLVLDNEETYRKKLKKNSGASDRYINRNMLPDIGLGAMLHDLGKKEIPRKIITQDGKLSDEEWGIMKTHPAKGYGKLQTIEKHINAPVRVPARQHHERYDGTGYPQGIAGDQIHLYGRLLAPADVYSALTSNRPYRNGVPPSRAVAVLNEMQEQGPHFDPEIFNDFLRLVFPYPVGEQVVLSDGRKGVVVEVDRERPKQPFVRILYERDTRVDDPEEIRVPNRPGELRILKPSQEIGDLARTRSM